MLGELDVVGIAALAGNQGLVFETPNGLANAEFHDGSLIKIARAPLLFAVHVLEKMGFGTVC